MVKKNQAVARWAGVRATSRGWGNEMAGASALCQPTRLLQRP